MESGRTEIISVHRLRRRARKREEYVQYLLDRSVYSAPTIGRLPPWSRGARVRKAGLFEWVVEATEWGGH